MAFPGKFEVASGAIDGVNTAFTVSSAYRPGSVAVFLNGQLKRRDFLDGWTETTPGAGLVTLTEAPIDGDVVQIFFVDASPNAPIDLVEVSPLIGKLVSVDDIQGALEAVQELKGVLAGVEL